MSESAGFRYEAFDRAGKRATGNVEAASEAEASRMLAAQGLTVSALSSVRPAWRGFKRGRASTRELQLMLHEFTTLLEAGVRLVTALSSLAHSSHHASLRAAFADMERMVRESGARASAWFCAFVGPAGAGVLPPVGPGR